MEKPAVRVWRRRVGTAYILFERSSRQSCSEGQGRRCLEGSAQPLSHPNATLHFIEIPFSKESLSPHSLVPKTGMLLEEQEKLSANQQ